MRYTRYEYKKQGKIKFITAVVLVASVSIGTGLYISNLIFDSKETVNQTVDISQSNNTSIQSQGIMALQCGYYSKKENADVILPTISSYCQPFIIEENGNYRVIAGLYDEELGMKKLEEFKSKGIDVAKVSIEIPTDTIESKKILEIIEGFLQITSKFEESDVKSVKTSEFKIWADGIINDGSTSESEKLMTLQSYVDSLPDEINKNNSSNTVQTLYTLIKS